MRVHPAANTTIPPLRNRQRHRLHPALLLLHAGPDPPESIVWKPTLTPGALPTNCNTYVQAKSGDTCRTILATYTFVTQQQFFAWLPFLNGNCNGLLAGYWYCTMACELERVAHAANGNHHTLARSHGYNLILQSVVLCDGL